MRARNGSFLVDTLLGMIILIMAIIPLTSSITFAYSALTSSVEKRAKLDGIYSDVERDILNFTINGGGFLTSFNKPTSTVAFRGGYPVTTAAGTPPSLYY